MKGLTILILCLLLQVTGWATCSFTVIPTAPGTYQATNFCVDGAWTHYFHETTTEALLLFSVKTTSVATFDPANVKVVIPNAGITRLSNAPYVVSGAPWVVLNKYWEASPNETMPLSDVVTIRVYFNEAEYLQIKNEINNNFNGDIQSKDDLIYFGFKSGFGINPNPTLANPHTNVDQHNFVQCQGINDTLTGSIFFSEMNLDDFIGGGIGGSTFGGVLPIELVDFKLEEENKQVKLSWTTMTEVDNDYFTIMHSVAGLEFREIGRVDGAGNSSTAKSYIDYDKIPAIGDNYYRLKQVDFNGIESISDIKVIKFRGTKYIDITPTLALDRIRIDIPYQFEYGAIVKIFNSNGQLVYESTIRPRVQRLFVDVNHLSPGMHQLKVSNGDIFLSKAFMKVGK